MIGVSHDSGKRKHDPLTLGIIGLRANLSIECPRKLYLRRAYLELFVWWSSISLSKKCLY
jgi:hypothetical protein